MMHLQQYIRASSWKIKQNNNKFQTTASAYNNNDENYVVQK